MAQAVGGTRTRGHPAALAAVRAALDRGGAHAILLVGPASVGKTTLALDAAAILLCTGAVGDARPCRDCRGCRMVESGNHPDLHRLAPDGPGGQIRIGERTNADPGTVRRLIADLSLMPVEGGARLAIVEQAHRMNEDAQSALLKTLEEPPAGVTIILSADEEERLLPTVRSRSARIRLGPVGLREIEAILVERGAADAATAGRLGRLAAGRPGVALAYALAPDAVVARAEVARTLLDLLTAPRAKRLAATRDLLAASAVVTAGLAGPASGAGSGVGTRPGRSRGSRGSAPAPAVQDESAADPADSAAADTTRRIPVAERRRAALQLVDIWRDVTRDLAVVQLGDLRSVRDTALLDDLVAATDRLPPGAAAAYLGRLTRAGELLESNVSPELVVDGLVIGWPRRLAVA